MRALQHLFLEQEAHLVSSLQDLFKDQEKRIATVIAASQDGPKATPSSPLPLSRFHKAPAKVPKVKGGSPKMELPNVPLHTEEVEEEDRHGKNEPKETFVRAMSDEKDDPPTIEESEGQTGQPKLLRKQVQPLQEFAEFHQTQFYHRRVGYEIYDTDTKFQVSEEDPEILRLVTVWQNLGCNYPAQLREYGMAGGLGSAKLFSV